MYIIHKIFISRLLDILGDRMKGKPLRNNGLPSPLPSDLSSMIIDPQGIADLLGEIRYSNATTATSAERELIDNMLGGSGESEDAEVTCEDLLSHVNATAYKAYRACFDVSKFLSEQGASLERNEEVCIDGIIDLARKLGINDINRNDLLKEHSYYAIAEAIDNIIKKIDATKELCNTEEDNDTPTSAAIMPLKMIAQKMLALKSPLARDTNILIAYGTNFIKFEYFPYIILTIATARNKKVEVHNIITSYDQLCAIESLALLEMEYHTTKELSKTD